MKPSIYIKTIVLLAITTSLSIFAGSDEAETYTALEQPVSSDVSATTLRYACSVSKKNRRMLLEALKLVGEADFLKRKKAGEAIRILFDRSVSAEASKREIFKQKAGRYQERILNLEKQINKNQAVINHNLEKVLQICDQNQSLSSELTFTRAAVVGGIVLGSMLTRCEKQIKNHSKKMVDTLKKYRKALIVSGIALAAGGITTWILMD